MHKDNDGKVKYILIIGDGMADDGLPELNGKTPLEYAKTPALDRLASAGVTGTACTIPEGLPPGSDTAILSIFGCDPAVYYSGRASLEAAASGIELHSGDTAFRCNMVTLSDGGEPFEDKKILSHSAGGIEGEISDALAVALIAAPDFNKALRSAGMEIFPAGSYRHIAVQRASQSEAHGECSALSASEIKKALCAFAPPHDHLGATIGPLLSNASPVLTDLMKLAHEALREHPVNIKRREEEKLPANGIWFWAQSAAAELPGFTHRYGKTGCVISAVPLCRGIGMLMGLTEIIVQGATGELNTNYEGKAGAAFEALRTNDFAAIHIEAPDECTHDGDLKGKLQAIEWIDSRIAAPLVENLRGTGTDFRMLVLSDHKTLMRTRGHDGSPVPFTLYDSRRDNRTGLRFCETDAEHGIGTVNGTQLMEMLFEVSS